MEVFIEQNDKRYRVAFMRDVTDEYNKKRGYESK